MSDVRYHRVNPTLWSQPWSHDAKMLALYLLTCDHRNTEGLFRLPQLYVRADLEWSAEQLGGAWSELVEDGFIEWDADASVVLIVNALRVQSPANPNGVKSALKQLELVPKSSLDSRFGQLAERYSERLAGGLPQRFTQSPAPAPAPAPIVQTRPMPDGTDPTPDAEVVPIVTDPPDVSEDATTLAREFAGMVAANGHPLPSKGSKAAHSWLIEADRLLRHGPPGQTTVPPPDLDRAIAVARWATSDIDFWAANVRSMPKFRKQWSQLVLQANRTRGRPDSGAVADQYAAAAAELRAQGR